MLGEHESNEVPENSFSGSTKAMKSQRTKCSRSTKVMKSRRTKSDEVSEDEMLLESKKNNEQTIAAMDKPLDSEADIKAGPLSD